ncbi:cyclic beta 1-2 glucan synthetase [Xanthomonas arboricola pv. juglandis]|uniref:hypothetical protein n=1 Tax=Xanthomonas TaxID=338 RepID=UPI000E96B2B4|nr:MULTISPECIES: hypothetical protein [Xanthomonas]CAD1790663.1 hypothetical protein XSP_001700 [Xanthomonas sp. CPBF 426]CAG2088491.1 hypothetical protein XCY_001664 [Xanthomonas euroxanthea]SYZ54602.1 cyclic beta 1-2 glucan synthetase [Xanthomonas arboricola pv. juglandis]
MAQLRHRFFPIFMLIAKFKKRLRLLKDAEKYIRFVLSSNTIEQNSRDALQAILPVIVALPFKLNLPASRFIDGVAEEIDLIWCTLEVDFDRYGVEQKIKNTTTLLESQISFHGEKYLPAIICAIHVIKIFVAESPEAARISHRAREIAALSGDDGLKAVITNSSIEQLLSSLYGESYAVTSFESKSYVHHFITEQAKEAGCSRARYLEESNTGGGSWSALGFGGANSRQEEGSIFCKLAGISLIYCVFKMMLVAIFLMHAKFSSGLLFLLLPMILDRAISSSELALSRGKTKRVTAFLDYRHDGFPFDVVVAVPIIFGKDDDIYERLSTISINVVIANDNRVKFVVLSDLKDLGEMAQQHEDDEFCIKLSDAILKINNDLGPAYKRCVTFAHRLRKYSPSENIWMGEDRKLGKLRSLSRFIAKKTCDFHAVGKDFRRLVSSAKFVMVLDQDSVLSRDCLHVLAGALDHPSNVVEITAGRVTSGYGLATPQLFIKSFSMKGWKLPESVVQGIANADGAPEAMSHAFNMYGRAGYFGKGMFDPALYEELFDSIDASRSLSHDTIEADVFRPCFIGTHAIFDSFPKDPFAQLVRDERWARGDFQNFLFRFVGRFNGPGKVGVVARSMIFRQCLAWVCLATLFPYLLIVSKAGGSILHVFFLVLIWFHHEFFRLILYSFEIIFSKNCFSKNKYIARAAYVMTYAVLYRLLASPLRFGQVIISLLKAIFCFLSDRRHLDWESMENSANRGSSAEVSFLTCFVYWFVLAAYVASAENWLLSALVLSPIFCSPLLKKFALKEVDEPAV